MVTIPWHLLLLHDIDAIGGKKYYKSFWKNETKWQDVSSDLVCTSYSFTPKLLIKIRFLFRRIRLFPDFIEEYTEEREERCLSSRSIPST